MDIRISGVIKNSIVDGKGVRYVIFTQGCPHACVGCHNQHTHDFNGGSIYNTEKISSDFKKDPILSGITLSGGEPVCQPKACADLAKSAQNAKLNVWMYSGYTFEEILELGKKNSDVLDLINSVDVLVDGKFTIEEKTLNIPFLGSKNQRVINVTESLKSGEVVLYKA